MKSSTNLKPLAIALGTTVIASVGTDIVNAADNPSGMSVVIGLLLIFPEGKYGASK